MSEVGCRRRSAHVGVIDDFSCVSTAGGAFLEWLEGKTPPGVKALEDAAQIVCVPARRSLCERKGAEASQSKADHLIFLKEEGDVRRLSTHRHFVIGRSCPAFS